MRSDVSGPRVTRRETSRIASVVRRRMWLQVYIEYHSIDYRYRRGRAHAGHATRHGSRLTRRNRTCRRRRQWLSPRCSLTAMRKKKNQFRVWLSVPNRCHSSRRARSVEGSGLNLPDSASRQIHVTSARASAEPASLVLVATHGTAAQAPTQSQRSRLLVPSIVDC
jgi:hypothetical protein